MKRTTIGLVLAICVLILACERHTTHITSDPRADSPSSGAKMLDSGGRTHPDSIIIDSNNYGKPKN